MVDVVVGRAWGGGGGAVLELVVREGQYVCPNVRELDLMFRAAFYLFISLEFSQQFVLIWLPALVIGEQILKNHSVEILEDILIYIARIVIDGACSLWKIKLISELSFSNKGWEELMQRIWLFELVHAF